MKKNQKQKKEITFSISCSCGQVIEKKPVESFTEYEVECSQCGLVVIFEVRNIIYPLK